MKSRLTTLKLMFVLLSVTYSTFSQNETNSSDKIKNLIAKKRSFNKKYGFGYRIQLYNGNEQKARKIRQLFRINFPNNFSKLIYNAPEWKVQVGNYKTKLEADKALIRFQEKFSGIIVVPMGK